jgi:glutamine synthetase
MTPQDVMKIVQENEVKFVDFRFTDTKGKEQHVGVPVSAFDEDKFESGHAFDGSSIAGWKGIQASDMLLMPDPNTAYIDPFFDETTLVLSCDVIDPADGKGYDRDPRSIANRAEAYLKSSGIGDTAYFGPEPEFFIFDSVEWKVGMSGAYHKIFSEEGAWSSDTKFEGGNTGYRPAVKGGYFPSRRSTPSTTCVPPCVWPSKPAACRLKCTTTKSRLPARTKSAPSSTPWCVAPTRPRS